jgi:hypothetical protein
VALESLIKAVLDRDGKSGGESTTVALHCAQMREWGVRGGNIELRPIQDDDQDTRLKYVTQLWQHNQFLHRLDHIMDCFVCRGEILWYFQPDPENPGLYRIEFFVGGQNHPDPQFKIYYKPGGREIDKCYIRYSYDYETPGIALRQQRWVRIIVTQDWVEQSETMTKPQFDGAFNAGSFAGYEPQGVPEFSWIQGTQRYDNPFKPYLPIVLSRNNARQLGQQGSDDFYWIQSLIETHEQLVEKAHKNLRMFSNPILVTTRSAQEVMQQASGWSNTWASANRYYDLTGSNYSGSTNPTDVPSWGMQRTPLGFWTANTSEGSLDTIFGNVGDSERFAFIQADAVSGDQNLWIRQIRELIHWVLGGVDPLGLLSGTTFGEIKTLFGRVQNTADKKSHALYGHTGLGKVLERILWREEQLFKNWLFTVLVTHYPKQFAGLNSPEQLTDEICQGLWNLKQQGVIQIPNNPVGILPLGDRTITWRYTREVFQNTTREELDRSIAARNEREDGLSQEWVLRKQYPNMTDQEIRNAMSGFSPRVVENAANSIQIALQLFQQFMQLPDPQNPKAAWGIRLGLPQLIEQAMLTLQKEISYGQPKYEPADDKPPLTLADIANQLSNLGGTINESLYPGNLTNSLPTNDVLTSMGLPTNPIDALSGRLYRSGYENPELRGSIEGQGSGQTGSGGYGSSLALFSGELPGANGTNNWGTGTPLGSVGNIDPSLLPLYADQLRALLAAYQQS